MFPRTKFKLDEARFFLQHLRESKVRESTFVYYFDAFISSLIGTLHALEAEYKQNQRRANKKEKFKQDSNIEQIQNLKNHTLIKDVRNPTHHGVMILPIKAIPKDDKSIIDTRRAWGMSIKVFDRLTGRIIVNGSFSSAGTLGQVMISISKDVKLMLPELVFIGNEEESANYEIEREFNWIIDLGEKSIDDCINCCESFFASIESLASKMIKEKEMRSIR